MIIKREKTWIKYKKHYPAAKYHQKSWWLFGIIPLYISNKLLKEG